MSDFWIPKYKWQLVDWLAEHCGWKKWKLRKKTLNELYAIYFDERKKKPKSTQ